MNDSKLAKVFNMFEQTCWIPTTVFWPQPWFSVQRVHFNSHLKLQSFELGEPPIPPSWKNCPPMLLWVPNMWGRGSKEAPGLSKGDGNCIMLVMCQVWQLSQFNSIYFWQKTWLTFDLPSRRMILHCGDYYSLSFIPATFSSWPIEGHLSWHSSLQGPSTLLHDLCCIQNYGDTRTLKGHRTLVETTQANLENVRTIHIHISVANHQNPFSLIMVKNELGAFSEFLGPPRSILYPIMTIAGL